ncbi:MAG: hypothetical protein M0P12_07630, partial [Paludibacteraceae bacterium]|nr:hypothetical protein [Paludibacteraceae bacterium]
NYEIKNENILYEKILNANLFAGLFEQDFESNFEHPTLQGPAAANHSYFPGYYYVAAFAAVLTIMFFEPSFEHPSCNPPKWQLLRIIYAECVLTASLFCVVT